MSLPSSAPEGEVSVSRIRGEVQVVWIFWTRAFGCHLHLAKPPDERGLSIRIPFGGRFARRNLGAVENAIADLVGPFQEGFFDGGLSEFVVTQVLQRQLCQTFPAIDYFRDGF